ncbi:hypothetical protein EXIGLDRAFT_480994 [Exidia glandulosa HHB12029]|uniref:RING-type E3 ubiquitin transferase n=1 Tax=Exidia glandulosa HHB12029 TaxID=1314781 RepID=A0A166NG69_EXIGL|nr:hypothetical protein EXIGLDRAFT_480994 [Exidia glandulosa HHB12029]
MAKSESLIMASTKPTTKSARRKNNKKPDTSTPPSVTSAASTADDAQSVDSSATPTCWICAEPVKYYALSECNHRTCHVCCLRLRALYKKRECTFCKAAQPAIVQTVSADAPFESFTPETVPFKDAKLEIAFESQEMMEDTLLLLRFNCPDPDCTFFGTGWGDLKQHVRAVHKKSMCHVCIGAKKIFAHEHTLYTNAELAIHVPSIRRREKMPQGASTDVEGGIHPLCEFCNECFFSDEELYPHMRDRHEKCFVCERQGDRFVYFRNYEELEAHFSKSHYPCSHATCREQKFVVFGTQLDLKAHTMEVHGSDLTSKDKRDARRVAAADFSFQAPESTARPNGAAGSRRRNGFGAALTLERSGDTTQTASAQSQPQPPPPRREEPPENLDPAQAARQTAFLARFSQGAAMAVHASMRSFRASESTARDVISTLFNVLERELDTTGSHITPLVEAFPDDKKQELLTAWNDFKLAQRREFPDLIPRQAAQGSEYAGITAGRVLNVKHNTAARSRRVWDRVEQAAASTSSSAPSSSRQQPPPSQAASGSTFPALGAAAAGRSAGGAHVTPWTSSTSSAQSFRPAVTARPPDPKPPGQAPTARRPPPKLSSSAFPSLPTGGPSATQTLRQQGFMSGNPSVRNIVGASQGAPSASAWGGAKQSDAADTAENDAPVEGAPAKGKKKGKQKQTLFTLGAFPA